MSHPATNINIGGEGLVVAGILSKLPVKSILRFMSVCRSWHSLISSSYFISSQLGNSNSNSHLILHQCDGLIRANRPTAIQLFHLDGSKRRQSMLLNFGFESRRQGDLFVVGSVRGLICYAAVEVEVGDDDVLSKFIIVNPEIGSLVSVPVPAPLRSLDYDALAKGFGFDDVSLDHKIFVAVPNCFVYLFSLNSNSWSCMPCQSSWDSSTGEAVFVKGCFHWLSYEYPRIDRDPNHDYDPAVLVFDIRSETFRRIPFQEPLPADLRIIAGFGESSIAIVQILCLPNSFVNHVWSMDRNGSWFKIANDVRAGKHSTGIQVLGFKNKREVLIRWGRVIVSQNIINRKLRSRRVLSMEAGSKLFTLHTYVPSLVLLDK